MTCFSPACGCPDRLGVAHKPRGDIIYDIDPRRVVKPQTPHQAGRAKLIIRKFGVCQLSPPVSPRKSEGGDHRRTCMRPTLANRFPRPPRLAWLCSWPTEKGSLLQLAKRGVVRLVGGVGGVGATGGKSKPSRQVHPTPKRWRESLTPHGCHGGFACKAEKARISCQDTGATTRV